MILDASINDESLSVQIDKPFQSDLDSIYSQIEHFVSSKGTNINTLDVKGLIPRMIKGIAGCEHGCPANAKDLEFNGYKGFEVKYVEGGILTASIRTGDGSTFSLKMFPDF